MVSTSRADVIRAIFGGDKVKRIDVYFGAAYDNGVFVRQPG